MGRGVTPRLAVLTLLLLLLSLAGIWLFFRGVWTFRQSGSPLAGTAFLILGLLCYGVGLWQGRRLKARHFPKRQ
jgi:hypothetical protein